MYYMYTYSRRYMYTDNGTLSSYSTVPPTTFKSRDQFTSVDEWSMYIKENIAVGMSVVCCETYEEIRRGDTGKVTKVRKI